jgi:hypothetical protein
LHSLVNNNETAIRLCREFGDSFIKLLLRNARLGDVLVPGVFDAVAEWVDIAGLQNEKHQADNNSE